MIGKNHLTNPQTASTSAATFATRSHNSAGCLAIRPCPSAQSLTAAVMACLADEGARPALTVPLARKVVPGVVSPRAEPTATPTGSTSAHAPASPTLCTVHFFEPV